MHILYSFRRCPYAMRARLALLVGDIRFELREVSLRDKPEAMIAVSAKATVPVLVLACGQVIDESIDIMRWALSQNDPEDWLGGDDADLIDRFDRRFKHHLDRYKYADRDADERADHRGAGLEMLAAIEPRLAGGGNLCRPARSLADMAIMPFVRQFAAVDRDWFDAQPVPGVQRWLAAHLASPLFVRAMAKAN